MLEAIQQLRDKAMAQGVFKPDEKTTVTKGRQCRHPAGSRRESLYSGL